MKTMTMIGITLAFCLLTTVCAKSDSASGTNSTSTATPAEQATSATTATQSAVSTAVSTAALSALTGKSSGSSEKLTVTQSGSTYTYTGQGSVTGTKSGTASLGVTGTATYASLVITYDLTATLSFANYSCSEIILSSGTVTYTYKGTGTSNSGTMVGTLQLTGTHTGPAEFDIAYVSSGGVTTITGKVKFGGHTITL